MATLITDPGLEEQLRSQRAAIGADHYDEVWEGVYRMPPMPNDEHQEIVMRLGSIFQEVVGWPGQGRVRPGVNVSDREADWQHNYRVPDVAVFLQGGAARNCVTHWLGGPDFVVEIISPDDQSRDKLPFYSGIGVGELLLVDRHPWSLELYKRAGAALSCVGRSSPDHDAVLTSALLPLTFHLVSGATRPQIEVVHTESQRSWLV